MIAPSIGAVPALTLGFRFVGPAGFEPATPAVSRQCSPTELRARSQRVYALPLGLAHTPKGVLAYLL
jgi:hypothetical protein